jgi:hypothetical protein
VATATPGLARMLSQLIRLIACENTATSADHMHAAPEVPWPYQAVASYGHVWDRIVAELTEAGGTRRDLFLRRVE